MTHNPCHTRAGQVVALLLMELKTLGLIEDDSARELAETAEVAYFALEKKSFEEVVADLNFAMAQAAEELMEKNAAEAEGA